MVGAESTIYIIYIVEGIFKRENREEEEPNEAERKFIVSARSGDERNERKIRAEECGGARIQ